MTSWLVLAWITAAPLIDIQRPILTLEGPPGSAKTSAGRMIRSIFDPAQPLELDVPSREDEFALAFYANPIPFFDNVSQFKRGSRTCSARL